MKKFLDALNGLKIALNHKACLIQIVLGIMAIIGGIIVRLDIYEWLAFIICIGLVIAFEVMNTAIEKIGDYLNLEYDEKIKQIKDLSSAAVLIVSIASFVICLLIIIRRLIK